MVSNKQWVIVTFFVLLINLLSCTKTPIVVPEVISSPTELPGIAGLTAQETAALASLTKIDDYPLYTMHSTLDTVAGGSVNAHITHHPAVTEPKACALFAAFGEANQAFYGRNFDWEYSPAVILFHTPADGFTSVSVVDLTYLVAEDKVNHLTELPIDERTELLAVPYWPFDGMNEHGLVVGMAAVSASDVVQDADLEWIGSLGIIREMLDHARNVSEAIDLMQQYNVSFEGGPQLHYLIADATGQAVLVEYYDGEFLQIPASGPWHAATNFVLSAVGSRKEGYCWRYDTISRTLSQSNGTLTKPEAMALLSSVAQSNTQWSVVYGIHTTDVVIAMGRDYDHTYALSLSE